MSNSKVESVLRSDGAKTIKYLAASLGTVMLAEVPVLVGIGIQERVVPPTDYERSNAAFLWGGAALLTGLLSAGTAAAIQFAGG